MNLYPYESQSDIVEKVGSEENTTSYKLQIENVVAKRIQLAINCKLITFCDR